MTTMEELKKQPYVLGKNLDVTPLSIAGPCVPDGEYTHLTDLTENEPPHTLAAAQTLAQVVAEKSEE